MTAEQTVHEYFDALTRRDLHRLLKTISSADFFVKIGTDAGEHVERGKDAVEYYRAHVASTEDFTIEFEHLDVQERERVAWFYTRQIWKLKWQGVKEELTMRITGVLEKEKDGWKFVQIHASVGLAG